MYTYESLNMFYGIVLNGYKTYYSIVLLSVCFVSQTSVVGSSFPGGGAYQWSTTATDVSSNAAAAASVRRTQTTVRRRPRISPSKFFGSLAAHGSCRPRVTANDAVTAAAADHAVSAAERSAAARTTATSSTAAPHAAIKSRVRTAFYALLTSRPAVPRSVIRAFARSFRVSERSLYALLPPPLRHVLLGYNAGWTWLKYYITPNGMLRIRPVFFFFQTTSLHVVIHHKSL